MTAIKSPDSLDAIVSIDGCFLGVASCDRVQVEKLTVRRKGFPAITFPSRGKVRLQGQKKHMMAAFEAGPDRRVTVTVQDEVRFNVRVDEVSASGNSATADCEIVGAVEVLSR